MPSMGAAFVGSATTCERSGRQLKQTRQSQLTLGCASARRKRGTSCTAAERISSFGALLEIATMALFGRRPSGAINQRVRKLLVGATPMCPLGLGPPLETTARSEWRLLELDQATTN